MSTAIRVENISKKYVIRHQSGAPYRTLRETIMHALAAPFRSGKKAVAAGATREEFYALKDISFEVPKGEVLGIIGRNGAGKSTLLKLLSRITEPTSGRISMKGRVASLLEVGTGFHQELTGRENVYLNGAVLGMTRAEIRRKFDEITAFAENEKFLDTPVKYYSSGMYMRLAFAVAAHLDPEILIVDEVLAVGDLEFQKKCMGKMEDISKGGRTVLFVSHNMGAISALCQRALLLRQGEIELIGDTHRVIQAYVASGIDATTWTGDAGNALLRLRRTWVRSLDPSGRMLTDGPVEVGLEIEVLQPLKSLILGFNLYSEYGYPLALTLYDDACEDVPASVEPGRRMQRFVIPANTLSAGTFRIQFDIGIHMVERIIDTEGELTFTMENSSGLGRRFQAPVDRRFVSLLRPGWAQRPYLDLVSKERNEEHS